MRLLAPAALAVFVLTASACPKTDPDDDPEKKPPPPPRPLVVNVALSPAAPTPPADPPPTDGILPSGIPDDVAVFDLGLVDISGGVSPDIFMDVESGVGGVLVLVYGHPGARVILERVVDPSGIPIVSDTIPDDLPGPHIAFARGFPAQTFSVNRVLGSLDNGAFLVPNTTSVAMRAGRYTMNVGHFTVDLDDPTPEAVPSDRPVRVVVLVTPSRPVSGTLDVAIHLTGSAGLTAATAGDNPFLQEAIDTMRIAYARADVAIGTVTFVDIDPALQTVDLLEDQCEGGELSTLFAAGAASDPATAPIFLIDRFSCVFGGTEVGDDIGGIAGGIPGPAFVRGSAHAGVAISTDFALGDGGVLGVVMAHELGHFLGLYHTRESTFFGNDPITDEIADTPEDLDGARENLMYFAADEAIDLSEGQGRVLRASPWVRAVR